MNIIKRVFWNAAQHRIRSGWRILIQVIFFFLLQIFFYILIRILTNISLTGPAESDGPFLFFLTTLISLIAALLSIWVISRFIDKRFFSDLGFHLSKEWWIDFIFGMILGIILMSIIFLVELGFGWIRIQNLFFTASETFPFILYLVLYFIIFTSVSISEELMFRGYFIKNLSEGFNFRIIKPHTAILISLVLTSLLFGLGHIANPHATWISSLNIALAGLLLGLGLVLTGELAIPLGLHLTWNFFQGNVFGFPVSGQQNPANNLSVISHEQLGPVLWTGGEFGPEAGLLATIIMLICIVFLFYWTKLRRKTISINVDIAQYKSIEIEVNQDA